MSFLNNMARQAHASDKRDCGRCLSSETCRRYQFVQSVVGLPEFVKLCYVVTAGDAEHRERRKEQQAKRGR